MPAHRKMQCPPRIYEVKGAPLVKKCLLVVINDKYHSKHFATICLLSRPLVLAMKDY